MNQVMLELEACVDKGGLLQAPADMARYLQDWTGSQRGEALAVARPSSTAQVSALMRVAATHHLAVTAQGGNTGLSGASVSRDASRSLLLSLDRMTAVREIDPHTPAITAEAGCILQTLQDRASDAGLCLPLGLGAEGSCTLGGVISTNAGGIRALRYGNCRENVMGIEAVLADGSVWNGLRALRKHNMGFDLKQLFIGAEGTLGVVTAAVMRLTPAWRQLEAAVVATPSPTAAMAILHRLRRYCGDTVVASELIEGFGLGLAFTVLPDATNPFGQQHPWYLLVEVASGAQEGTLRESFEAALVSAMEAGEATDAVFARSQAQRAFFWKLREGVVMGQKSVGATVKHDVSVPVGAVPAFIKRATAAALALVPGARPLSFGHVGDGNIHFTVLRPVDADPAAFLKHAGSITSCTHDSALALGGSISAEHGIGSSKLDEFERIVDPVELGLFQRIKQALDPEGRMNPGVLLRDQNNRAGNPPTSH
jgi:FAD/FMN-containing dehydrogenase